MVSVNGNFSCRRLTGKQEPKEKIEENGGEHSYLTSSCDFLMPWKSPSVTDSGVWCNATNTKLLKKLKN